MTHRICLLPGDGIGPEVIACAEQVLSSLSLDFEFIHAATSQGTISTQVMYGVFNTGIGIVAIGDQSSVAHFQTSLSESTFVSGELIKGVRKTKLN